MQEPLRRLRGPALLQLAEYIAEQGEVYEMGELEACVTVVRDAITRALPFLDRSIGDDAAYLAAGRLRAVLDSEQITPPQLKHLKIVWVFFSSGGIEQVWQGVYDPVTGYALGGVLNNPVETLTVRVSRDRIVTILRGGAEQPIQGTIWQENATILEVEVPAD